VDVNAYYLTTMDFFPTGTILLTASLNLPTGWLSCDGSAVSRTTYAALQSALTYLVTASPTSGSPTLTSVDTSKMFAGMPIESSSFPSGTTVASVSGTTATMSANATATGAVGINLFPFGNGNGSTTFNLPNLCGRVPVGAGVASGLTSRLAGQSFGEETHVLSVGELPSHTHPFGYNLGAGSSGGSNPRFANFDGPPPTLSATQATGSGSAHNNIQPSLVLYHMIRT
jgi:microcystin-dependent protein